MSDHPIRLSCFSWLVEQTRHYGDALPRTLLAEGFEHNGRRVRLVGPQGIFKPRDMQLPLSITTTANSPYADCFDRGGLLRYSYRGTRDDVNHRDNKGLRQAMSDRVPLVYFHGLVPGFYLAAWPVFVIDDIQQSLQFRVAVDESEYSSIFRQLQSSEVADQSDVAVRRRYKTQEVRRRLHQAKFRERVLRAYQERCAMCRLAHRGLLDAAHIIPDSVSDGEASVSNGLALCKIHHAAFDQFFVGISPDLRIVVRKRLLEEVDGPMLRHGLQELHGLKITVPRSSALRPSQHSLASRFSDFERQLLND